MIDENQYIVYNIAREPDRIEVQRTIVRLSKNDFYCALTAPRACTIQDNRDMSPSPIGYIQRGEVLAKIGSRLEALCGSLDFLKVRDSKPVVLSSAPPQRA